MEAAPTQSNPTATYNFSRLVSKRGWNTILLSLFSFFAVNLLINLERILFINEIFSFFGILCAARHIYLSKTVLASKIEIVFFMLILYSISQLIYGAMFISTTSYLFFRTTPLVYSMFSFFLGMEFTRIIGHALYFLDRLPKKLLYLLTIVAGWRVTVAAGLILFVGKTRRPALNTFILFSIFYILSSVRTDANDLTSILIILFFALACFFHKNVFLAIIRVIFNRYFLSFFLSITIALLWLSRPLLSDFLALGYVAFEGTAHNNTIWRFMFWVLTVSNVTTDNPMFGIGIGTPIYDYSDPDTSFLNRFGADDESQPFTLGLHNSFLDIYVRLGAIGLTFFVLLLSSIIRHASQIALHNETVFVVLLLTLSMLIGATFNVVLLTPLAAGSFWICLGLLYGLSRGSPSRDRVK